MDGFRKVIKLIDSYKLFKIIIDRLFSIGDFLSDKIKILNLHRQRTAMAH